MTNEQTDIYRRDLRALQIELVKWQHQMIADNARVLILIEGRDGAGKDGTIKRLTEHMSPRETRVFAPRKPTDRDRSSWYFQRYVAQLPAGEECVIFNRSWYNRAGVERVMGYCTNVELEPFFDSVVEFESLLVRSGMEIRKYYLDISRAEQKERLADRHVDPLKAWKSSPVDAAALKKWSAYTAARDEMFRRTSHRAAPWRIVRGDHKKVARLALLRDLLESFSYKGKKRKLVAPDRNQVFFWTPSVEADGLLAR